MCSSTGCVSNQYGTLLATVVRNIIMMTCTSKMDWNGGLIPSLCVCVCFFCFFFRGKQNTFDPLFSRPMFKQYLTICLHSVAPGMMIHRQVLIPLLFSSELYNDVTKRLTRTAGWPGPIIAKEKRTDLYPVCTLHSMCILCVDNDGEI